MDIDTKLKSSLDTIIADNSKSSNEKRKPAVRANKQSNEPKRLPPKKRARDSFTSYQQRPQPVQKRFVEDQDTITVARRVFVGNVDHRATWQELKDHFRAVGNVLFAEILKEPNGSSKGCGIVEFSEPEEAAKAIEQMQQTLLHNRPMFVREDREDKELLAALGGKLPGKQQRTYPGEPSNKKGRASFNEPAAAGYTQFAGQFNGHFAPGPSPEEAVLVGRRLFVSALNPVTTWQAVKDHFKRVGPVAHAALLQHEDGSSRGCGVVEMTSAADALKAISQLSNSLLDGAQILVREYREGKGAPSGPPVGTGPRAQTRGTPSGPPQGEVQVVVQGLPFSMGWQGLKDVCRERTRVEAARATISSKPDGSSKGWGLLHLRSMQEAQTCIKGLHGFRYDGRVLTAKLDSRA